MSKKENPMAVRSKIALTSALLRLLMKKEFIDIPVSEITEEAGLSRQTFYSNFAKREDILDYLITGLFERFASRLAEDGLCRRNLIVDYLLFWDGSRKLLQLLFARKLSYMFQAKNREFFIDPEHIPDSVFSAAEWQLPYIRASLAGVTYELLWLWLTDERGLSVDALSSLAENLLTGRMFVPADTIQF